jgi:hypothetical protein
MFFNIEVIPDTGVMVTAILASEAAGLKFNRADMFLLEVVGQVLNTLGAYKALIEL